MNNGYRRFLDARLILPLFLAAFLVACNLSIAGKERLLSSGETMILRLAPVDPRSLMQGDYMALDFAEADAMYHAARDLPGGGAFVAVMLRGENGVYSFARLHDGADATRPDERLLRFKIRGRRAVIGGGSFFFEEGAGDTYAQAQYAKLHVDGDGTAIIGDLLYEDFTPVRVEREKE